MESYDVFLANNFLALPAFESRFGTPQPGGGFNIPPQWTSALSCSTVRPALALALVHGEDLVAEILGFADCALRRNREDGVGLTCFEYSVERRRRRQRPEFVAA